MIRPFVDAMSVSPEGGHALFDSSANSGTQPASSAQSPTVPQSSSEPVAGQHATAVTSLKVPQLVTYSDSTVVFLLPHLSCCFRCFLLASSAEIFTKLNCVCRIFEADFERLLLDCATANDGSICLSVCLSVWCLVQ